MVGRGSQGVWDGHVHTAIFKIHNQHGPTVQHRELCSMLHGSLDGRGVQGRGDTCICVAESLRCPPNTITTLLIGYMPNIKLKKFLKQCQGTLHSGPSILPPFTLFRAQLTSDFSKGVFPDPPSPTLNAILDHYPIFFSASTTCTHTHFLSDWLFTFHLSIKFHVSSLQTP